MDGSKIMKGLTTGLLAIGVLLGGYVGLAITMYVVGIVLGILFDVGTTLGLDGNTTEFLGNVSSNWYEFAGSLLSGTSLIGTLVQVAIVIVVFGGFIYLGYKGYKKFKGSKGDNSY